MNDKPDGRRVHHWRGKDRATDLARLADAIAAAIELYNRDGTLVRLDENGEIVAVNFADFRKLIDKAICGVRLARRGTKCQREFFTYEFAPPQRPDASKSGPRPPPDNSKPDSTVLDEIYRHELIWRLPKVEE
jgi:hypothetical protein